MAVAHYLEALDWQREFIKMHAVLGGKNPHLQSFLVGGMATPVDPDSQAALNIAHDRAAEVVRRVGARVRRRRSTFPICWPSPRSTRTGPATAAASATTSSSATTPRTTRRSRRCSSRRASSAGATSRRSSRSTRPRSPSTSRTPGTATTQGDDAPLHPLKGETTPNFTGPEPAVRAARHRQEVPLAEVAALRRRADGSRPARAHAGRRTCRATRRSSRWSTRC